MFMGMLTFADLKEKGAAYFGFGFFLLLSGISSRGYSDGSYRIISWIRYFPRGKKERRGGGVGSYAVGCRRGKGEGLCVWGCVVLYCAVWCPVFLYFVYIAYCESVFMYKYFSEL